MIKKILFLLLFILLVTLSIFPRITEVVAHNYIFGFDQGRDFLAAKSIIVDHKLTLIGSEWGAGSAGLTGLFHGPGYFYFLSLAFVLFAGDPYGGVVFMFLLGILTIILSFFIGKKLLGLFGGYIFALLVAISPPLIGQSRFFWNTYPSSPLILMVFYFTYRINMHRKRLDILLASFFSAFIYNFQTGIAIPLCIALIIYTVLLLRFRKLKDIGTLIAGFVLGFLPFFLFELRHNFQGVLGIIAYIFADKKTDVTLLFLQILLKDHLNSFIYAIFDSFPNTNLPWWVLASVIFLPLFYFWYKEEDRNIRFFLIYLFIIPFIAFTVFAPLRNSVYPYYLRELTFIILFFFAYISSRAIRFRNTLVLSVVSVLFVWFLALALKNSYLVFVADVKDYGGGAKIKGKIDAIRFIYDDAKGKPFNLLVFTPPVYTYPYDYLLWWYGQKKYGYLPGSEKKGNVYLLIETDHEKPWTYKGWLETVIKDGKVVDTITLPSGLIVQKRTL
ncbi:MAG: glycosyltransferase family 39 protein [bacterium]|nr:glycosyltransferase family 39 protein [bacterium]